MPRALCFCPYLPRRYAMTIARQHRRRGRTARYSRYATLILAGTVSAVSACGAHACDDGAFPLFSVTPRTIASTSNCAPRHRCRRPPRTTTAASTATGVTARSSSGISPRTPRFAVAASCRCVHRQRVYIQSVRFVTGDFSYRVFTAARDSDDRAACRCPEHRDWHQKHRSPVANARVFAYSILQGRCSLRSRHARRACVLDRTPASPLKAMLGGRWALKSTRVGPPTWYLSSFAAKRSVGEAS